MLWSCIRLPALVREALAASEREAIERLAAWAYQWSSLVAYRLSDGTHNDAPAPPGAAAVASTGGNPAGGLASGGDNDGGDRADEPLLWLELGASNALFGGHAALLARIRAELTRLGYSHRCALAPSPTAAALLARAPATAERCVFTRSQLRTQLARLPLTLLEQPPQILAALQAAGLRRIGEVLALPAAALARRFGPQCCAYLARLTGDASDPLTAWRLPLQYRARCEFDQDVHDTTALLFPLQRLLQEFQGYLRGRDVSVQNFTLELEHHGAADHSAAHHETGATGRSTPLARSTSLPIGLSAPGRDAARFLLLARERLQGVALAAPIRALQLSAEHFTAPAIEQADLFGGEAQQLGELTQLLDRLHARLGEQSVQSYRCHADHRPERAWRTVPPGPAAAQPPQPPTLATRAVRPAALLPAPRRIAPPRQILSGPERIESGWWDGAEALRDYYVVRAEDGARQWVFRDLSDGGWYLQGLWV